MNKLLDVKEISTYLGVHPRTVYKWKNQGKIPYIAANGRIRFKLDDIEKWLKLGNRKTAIIDKILKNVLTISPSLIIDNGEGGQKVARSKRLRRRFPYGSIYQRRDGGNWTIDFRTATGERIQKVVKAMTWQDAHEVLKEAVYDSYFGHHQNKQRVTFERLADMYIEDHAKTNKLSWRDDQRIVREMKKYFMGRSADSITAQDVERYKAWRRRQGVKPTTVNKSIQILSKLCSCGVSWGYLESNPCRGVKKYSEEKFRRTRVLSREEESRLEEAIGPEYLKAMVKLFLNCGLRRKELFQLTWKDHVDFRKCLLFIRETKTSRSRYIPMNETVYNVLRELHWSRTDDGLVFRNPKTKKGYVCIRKTFNRACKKAKIENLNLLDLRRTFGSRILEAGASLETVRQLLGHVSVTTTQIYTISNAEQKLQAVSLLDPNRVESGDKSVTNRRGQLVSYGFSVN